MLENSPEALEHELSETAKKMRRSKSFLVREDINDYYIGIEALNNTRHIYSSEEIRKELGLDDKLW